WHQGDHLARATQAAGFDLAAMDKAIEAEPDRYEQVIAANEKDHAASGHWGVPTFVFEKEPFFGQDRIDLLIWRMEAKGLTRRNARRRRPALAVPKINPGTHEATPWPMKPRPSPVMSPISNSRTSRRRYWSAPRY